MAFPWLFAEGLDDGARGQFDVTSDPAGLLTIAHFTELARAGLTPYQGAYSLRVTTTGGVTDGYLQENTGFDTGFAGIIFWRWYFYLAKDFVMADGDRISMCELQTITPTTQAAGGVQRSGNNLQFWFGHDQAAATIRTFTLGDQRSAAILSGTTTLNPSLTALGKWYHAEMRLLVSSTGVATDGTLDAWIDDATAGAQITGLTNPLVIEQARWGALGPDAGTSGTYLLDTIIADDGRIGRTRERFRTKNAWVTYDDHPIIGPGTFRVALTGTATDAVLYCYDTDGVPGPGANTGTGSLSPILVLRNTVANQVVTDITDTLVNHGLYCVLSGTNPQAFVNIKKGFILDENALIQHGLGTGRPSPGGY